MEVRFTVRVSRVDVYDFIEVVMETGRPIDDPFRTVEVTGVFRPETGAPIEVSGFCDSQDGSVYALRFMPTVAGEYDYTITLRHDGETAEYEGHLTAILAGRRGLLEVDPDYPESFRWRGTGETYFWNASTAYLMAGCTETQIHQSLGRFRYLGINRVRVSLCPSRQANGGRWFEPQVGHRRDFSYCYGPWLQARPESVTDPGWDVTRFEVAYWRKFERLLVEAHELDIIVQVVFFTDAQEPQNYPFDRDRIGDDPDERRYYDYAVARLASYSNVEWCVTNEWALFRPDEWVEEIGAYLHDCDPYGHLLSVHGHERFPFGGSSWCTHVLYQMWDEGGGHDFILQKRCEQAATGTIKPVVNEEYGYEDHYPRYGGASVVAPGRDALNRSRLAWEIVMAGGWATTGESAANGLGGWINGIGDDSTDLLKLHRHMKTFFERFLWWKAAPADELVDGPAWCRAEIGYTYALYFRGSEPVSVKLEAGGYRMRTYDALSGAWHTEPEPLKIAESTAWPVPAAALGEDRALLIERLVEQQGAG